MGKYRPFCLSLCLLRFGPMVLVRSFLAPFCLLGRIFGTTASPVSQEQQNEDAVQRSQQQERDNVAQLGNSMFSSSIDWKVLDEDAQSLFNVFAAQKISTSSRPATSSTSQTQSELTSPRPTSETPTPSTTTSTPSTSAPLTSKSSSSTSSHPVFSSSAFTSTTSHSTTTPHSTSTPSSTTTKPTSQTSTTATRPTTTITSSSTPTSTSSIQHPVFSIYTDQNSGFPTSQQIFGYNNLILSFFLSTDGAVDQAAAWTQLSDSQRASIRADYRKNGISLMVSACGATDLPTTLGVDPTKFAQTLAAWAIEFDMDGVDVDYEDFQAVSAGTALAWLKTFTQTLRAALPVNMVLTHAPVAPWLGLKQIYFEFEQQVGQMVDWYHIQFYSQGNLYTDCNGLLTESGGAFPGTSLFELIAAGLPQEKLLIGKPAALIDVETISVKRSVEEDSSFRKRVAVVNSTATTHISSTVAPKLTPAATQNTNGFMPASVLSQCLATAVAQGWNAGFMVWEYPDATVDFIKQVRTPAFPLPNN